MVNDLYVRASKNFEQYLRDFQEKGTVRFLPRSRLTDQEWNDLNRALATRGVCMTPTKQDGISYMMFNTLNKQQALENVAHLKNRASRNFDKYLRAFLDQGEVYMLPQERLTDDMWRELNKSLISYGVRLVPTNHKGAQYMMFRARPKQRTQAKQTDPVLDSILGEYKIHKIKRGVIPAFIYDQPGISERKAQTIADKIMAAGQHYATVLSKSGTAGVNDHIVIAIKKYDAENNLGAVWEYNRLLWHLDSKDTKRYIQKLIGYPLTYINNTPVIIESMDDFGATSERAILLVSVGGKKLPFYISTGSAGKTDVPTGKWEFFGGISNGWFRKGNLENILTHYNSPELKQIADALDGKIGDIRDTVDILKSAGREYLGGQGNVAYAMNTPKISIDRINQDVFIPQNEGNFYLDLKNIKEHLSGLARTRNVAQKINNAENKLKSSIFSRVLMWINGNNNNQQS